ncbi:Ig-like domain-containing protein [Streptococcus suis]
MKKLVQKIMAGLAILLVSMGLVSSQLASAAEHSDVVTAVTITDTAGNPITEVGQFQTFRINADFALPDGQIKAGDTTVISLPDSIILSSGTAFEVKDSSGNVVANATVDSATKKVTLVYTDYPSTHSDV